jgi:hypothetical protein
MLFKNNVVQFPCEYCAQPAGTVPTYTVSLDSTISSEQYILHPVPSEYSVRQDNVQKIIGSILGPRGAYND